MVDLRAGLNYPPETVARYRADGSWTDETPQDWLAELARTRPDAPAAIGLSHTLSYRDLHDQALGFANGLLAAGLAKGDRIGVQLPNLPEFLVAYHGIQLMGGVIALLHMPYRAGELAPLLNHGGVQAVICHAGLPNYDAASTMLGLKNKVPTLETVIVQGGEAVAGTLAFDDLIAAPAPIADPPDAADPAVLAFTSGTSASPKAVVHANRTMACSHRALAVDCGLGPDDVVLSAPPFTHIYGLNVANITLRAGAASGLMALYTPPAFAQAIAHSRPTVMFCGPAHALACIKAGLFEGEMLASLKRVVFAGSACPAELVTQMEALCPNATVYQMWGMTETLMQFINPTDAPREVRLASIGTPPVGHEIRAVADGRIVGPGEEGELEIRGPMLFAGYFDNTEANAAAFSPDGWFRTGDLVTIDEDQNVVMTGRVKDIINRGGIKINPADIEGLIDEHPAVVMSAIAPMPDEVMGEKACLFVQLQPGASLTLPQVQDYLASKNVAKLKWPERLEVVEAMPMTPTRKIIKGQLVAGLT
jgi:cyclohexanecarboxylate-CoA ligase